MKRFAETQWRELSALYDEAEPLDDEARALLLARLRANGHPLHDALRDMLAADLQAQTQDFLAAPARALQAVDRERRAAAWEVGSAVGPYRLLRWLGSGGMADVWLAERSDGLRREVALKLPHEVPRSGPSRAAWALRFERERDILASLRHTHIAGLLDAGASAEGQPWLALEYVRGEPIDRYCDTRNVDIAGRVELMRQVLLAVQHAHANLVVHRDLKPANILVDASGEVRLLDFGIAKLMAEEATPMASTELTRVGGRVMTPRYASPEQLLGHPLGTRSDVYSLGVLLYELLCGASPYELRRDTAVALERAIVEHEPRAPSRRELPAAAVQARAARSLKALRRELAPELDAVVLRALAKLPEHRYSSVDAMLADVDRWRAGEPVQARAPSLWLRTRKFARRHRWSVGFGSAALIGMVLLTSVSVMLGLRAREESARAMAARDFVFDMFRRADPEQARGQAITASDLLAWGQKQAIENLRAQPGLQADLLEGIGGAQQFDGDDESAQQTYAYLAGLYRGSGQRGPLAMALANAADASLRLSQLERAADQLREAALAAPSPPSPAFEVRLSQLRGLQAYLGDDLPEARRHYNEAISKARTAWGPRDPRAIDSLRGLADAERDSHDYAAAIAHIDEAQQLAAGSPGLRTGDAAGLVWEQAATRWAAGRFAEVAEQLALAYPECVARLGRRYETCAMMYRTRAVALLRIGDAPGAQALLSETLAQAGSGPERTPRQLEALIVAGRLLAHAGRAAEPLPVWRDLEAMARAEGEAAPLPWLQQGAVRARAESWLLAGQPERALPWLQRGLAALQRERSLDTRDRALIRVLMGHARLLLGEPGAALEWFRLARADAAESGGAQHPLTQLLALNEVSAWLAIGQPGPARAVLAEARPILEAALGPHSPMSDRLQALAADAPAAAPSAPSASARAVLFY